MSETKTIINIGREFGSGGKSIASEIGKILGIEVYGNELISKAEEESGFSKELFQRSDERRSLFSMSSLFGTGRFGTTPNFVSGGELFNIQSKVVQGIAEKGPAIFVGRCANYILREMNCLNVFVTAPVEDRIKRVATRTGLTAEEAKSLIERNDRERETYYNFFTFGDWGAASDYDLCVNSSLLGIEGTARFIIGFGKETGKIR